MKRIEDKYLSEEYIFILSLFLHIIVVFLFYHGAPVLFKKIEDTPPQIISFEMLPITEVANIKDKKTAERKENSEKSQEAKKIKNTKTANVQNVVKEEKEAIKPKEQIQNKKSKDVPAKKKIVSAPVKKQHKAPVDNPNTKQAKVAKKQEEDIIDSLLKNLEDASEGKTSKSNKRNLENKPVAGKFAKGAVYDETMPLSVTEHMLIKQQVEINWRPPIGAKNLAQAKVKVHMSVDPDGTIKEVEIQGYECPIGSESTCQLLAESAIRAVKATGKLKNMMPDRYESWKEINLLFEPSDIAD